MGHPKARDNTIQRFCAWVWTQRSMQWMLYMILMEKVMLKKDFCWLKTQIKSSSHQHKQLERP